MEKGKRGKENERDKGREIKYFSKDLRKSQNVASASIDHNVHSNTMIKFNGGVAEWLKRCTTNSQDQLGSNGTLVGTIHHKQTAVSVFYPLVGW